MFAATVSYVFGLFAYFIDKPVLFAGIFTLASVILLIKEIPGKYVLIWIGVFYFGFFNANLRIKNIDTLFKLAPSNAVITGQIVSVPNNNLKHNTKFFFKADKIKINDETYENINNKTLAGISSFDENSDFSDLKIGNYYEISGKLRRPFTSTNPSQFSYSNYLKNFNTYTTFYADKKDIKQINKKLTFRWKMMQYLNNKRENILKSQAKYIKSPNNTILGGIIFGDDAVAPPDYIKASFIHSGLLHILAASGMNVAFISSFLFFFMIRLGVPYKIRIASGIFVTILYCLMTGLGASVIRAGLMLIFILFGKLIDRDAHSISLLSFVALLMLIYNPAFINDVSFQLSFIVTLGILLTAEAILQYIKNVPAWLSGSILIPIVAQLWVIPVQMFYFNTISVYSVFANILSMPFLMVLSFGGFLCSTFALLEPIANFVCHIFSYILNPCLNILVYISGFFAHLPHSLYTTTHPNVLQVLLYYIILSLLIYLIKIRFENKNILKISAVLSLVLILSATVHLPNHNFEVISFDVGNADAFLLKSPRGKYFVIDTGKTGYDGRRSQADIIMLKYMKDNGIKDIEGLIITHFDADHAGGAVDIMKNTDVKKIYLNSVKDDKKLAQEIYKTADSKRYTYKVLAQNDSVIYKEPNFEIKTFRADIPQHGSDKEANENSVITLVKNHKTTMLFTGDSGVKAFEQIKPKLPQNITVLKVGHHGAKDVVNKEMLEYLNPEISLVSVGYNKYGHPNPATIKLLSKTKIVRTDKIHAIKIISCKNGYEIDGYDSTKRRFYKKYSKKCN
ncbi:MAG: DNA internalization-related competence protein ComEC/Rec2 [Cyanobacteria bacterium RUI128]|nr:DNA internalization-related competence protein ComEC/Rec2 [Cyanobacteria bacterium RUI128]